MTTPTQEGGQGGKGGGRKEGGGGRGRRWPGRGQGPRRTAGPTLPRMIAIRVVERVQRAGAYADLALHHALVESHLPAADRALATELVYGTLRWRGRLDYLIHQALDRDPAKLEPLVASALRVGAYQLFFSDRIPASAAVDEAVRCARAMGLERATGLINAVLRRLAREGAEIALPELASDPLGHLVHACSLPVWLAERWLAELGPEEAAALATALNAPAPVTARANRTQITRAALLEELHARFPDAVACRYAPDGIVLGGRGDPGQDPAFLGGRMSLQDEASQLVVELLDPQPGDRILDTCAAPGTKTAAIAERLVDGAGASAAGDSGASSSGGGPSGRGPNGASPSGEGSSGGGPSDESSVGHVLALDRHPRRLKLVARGIRRLRIGGVATLERDATKSLEDLLEHGGPFDRILVDAPCSGLGSLRRNPDARWRIQPRDLAELAVVQRAILESAAAVLRPGGSLVYSTCTLTREENDEVVRGFLATRSRWRIASREEASDSLRELVDEGGALRIWPHRHDMDGFFAVRLIKPA